MKISVRVSTRSSKNGVTKPKTQGEPYRVYVHDSPVDGKANREVVRLLSKYFSIAPSCISIIRGNTSRNKIVELEQ